MFFSFYAHALLHCSDSLYMYLLLSIYHFVYMYIINMFVPYYVYIICCCFYFSFMTSSFSYILFNHALHVLYTIRSLYNVAHPLSSCSVREFIYMMQSRTPLS